jgi:hypothetical protein
MVVADVGRDNKTFMSSSESVPSCAASVARFVGIVIDNPLPERDE